MDEKRGWLFPGGLDLPENNWYRMEFGDTVAWDIDREGHEYMARQSGATSLTSNVVSTGTAEGVLYAAVEAELTLELDGEEQTYRAVSGADATSQQVRDPEHVWSVAESRAVKRVVKRALGIRSTEQTREDGAVGASESSAESAVSESSDSDSGQPHYPDPENNDDDIDW